MGHKEHYDEHGHWFLYRQDIPVTLHTQIFSPAYWQSQGAQLSERVAKLLKDATATAAAA